MDNVSVLHALVSFVFMSCEKGEKVESFRRWARVPWQHAPLSVGAVLRGSEYAFSCLRVCGDEHHFHKYITNSACFGECSCNYSDKNDLSRDPGDIDTSTCNSHTIWEMRVISPPPPQL